MNLIFKSKGNEHAISLSEIKEVVKRPALTPVPFVSSRVIGIFSLRGTLVTVVDETEGPGPENAVVVLNHPPYQVGILVDKVVEVREGLKGASSFDVPEVVKAWNV